MDIKANRFTFDYSKYNTGLSATQLRVMISDAVQITGITNTVLYCLKCIMIMILSGMLQKQVDVEKEKERQDWEAVVAGGSQTNVDINS